MPWWSATRCGTWRRPTLGDLPTLGVLSGGFSRQELEAAGAVAVVEDVAELIERLDELIRPAG